MDDHANLAERLRESMEALGLRLGVTVTEMNSVRPDVMSPYLMIAVDLEEVDANLERIAHISRLLVGYFIANKLAQIFGGLEILSRIERNGISVRLTRLSILPIGLDDASQISAETLKLTEPFRGVSSKVYLREWL